MSDDRLLSKANAVLADALGVVIAELKQQWQQEKQVIVAEAKAAVLEVKNAALEIRFERHDPEKVARLRVVEGRRDPRGSADPRRRLARRYDRACC